VSRAAPNKRTNKNVKIANLPWTRHGDIVVRHSERASGCVGHSHAVSTKLLADALGFARFVLHERSHRVPRSSNLLQATNST